MIDPRRIATVHHARRQPFGDPQLLLDPPQQQHAAVRRQPASIERDIDLLAANRWQRKRQKAIVFHGGCGAP